MLRVETKRRARALQLLYAWELRGEPIPTLAAGLSRLTGPEPSLLDGAEELAAGVAAAQAAVGACRALRQQELVVSALQDHF